MSALLALRARQFMIRAPGLHPAANLFNGNGSALAHILQRLFYRRAEGGVFPMVRLVQLFGFAHAAMIPDPGLAPQDNPAQIRRDAGRSLGGENGLPRLGKAVMGRGGLPRSLWLLAMTEAGYSAAAMKPPDWRPQRRA